ncbi:sensor histidine kinase [Actinoplanes sp. NPDC051859]|uniref:sensor histidine kinase n=1 Tax=Actinoplanes sp. NPDC051859 TaxID=3363909 RepID=UPI0037A0D08D
MPPDIRARVSGPVARRCRASAEHGLSRLCMEGIGRHLGAIPGVLTVRMTRALTSGMWTPPWRIAKPPIADVLLASGLSVLTLATVVGNSDGHVRLGVSVAAVLTVAPLACRQQFPLSTMSVIVASLSVYGLFGFGDYPNGGVGMLIAMFTVATLRTREVAAVMFVTTLIPVVVASSSTPGLLWSQSAQAILVVLGAWMLGNSTRRWGQREQRIGARAERAVADERVRIARELHDVVAHHMTVISLQAGVAEYVLDDDTRTAKAAISTVADASRDALAEMRRLLDVLRLNQPGDPTYRPQPGLHEVESLIRRMRAAGLTVTFEVSGPVSGLAPGADLCVYRVVQESLTNVLKHAGKASVTVDIVFGEHAVTVKISDDGRPEHRAATATSHGIRGMRERAELYGGVLTAGPTPQGGFTVLLRLPLNELR